MILEDQKISSKDYVTVLPIKIKMLKFANIQKNSGPKIKTPFKKYRNSLNE